MIVCQLFLLISLEILETLIYFPVQVWHASPDRERERERERERGEERERKREKRESYDVNNDLHTLGVKSFSIDSQSFLAHREPSNRTKYCFSPTLKSFLKPSGLTSGICNKIYSSFTMNTPTINEVIM